MSIARDCVRLLQETFYIVIVVQLVSIQLFNLVSIICRNEIYRLRD